MATRLNQTTINITLGTILKTAGVIVAAIVIFLLRDLVLVILTSVVVASAAEPAAAWLQRRGLPRVPSVLLIYLAAIGLLFVLIPIFIFPVISDIAQLSATLPATLGNLTSWFQDPTSTLNILSTNLGAPLSLAGLIDGLQAGLVSLPRGFVQTASFIFGGFLSFILVIVFSFYLAVQADGIENFLRVVTPIDRENYIVSLWRRAQKKIGLWMQGQVLLGLIIGVLVYLGLMIFRIPYALVLALVAAVFELIPFFGPILSAVPAVLLAFSGGATQGVIILAFYIIIQQFENHLIYPLVVRKMVGVPSLLVIIAMIAGAKLFGFLGIILAVPASVVMMELITDWEKQRQLTGRQANV